MGSQKAGSIMTFFSRNYDRLMGPLENKIIRSFRERLLRTVKGNVLEIGSGTGLNFSCYREADQVVAIEPNRVMREKSMIRAEQASVPIEVVGAGAEKLPFEDQTFDAVVGTLVLCTIPDPESALLEMKRVCKTGGTLVFLEHVRMNHALWGRLQDWLTPAWSRVCDGCHLNRNAVDMIQKAGFRIVTVEKKYKGLVVVIHAEK
ncbi:class I SAM-dependent methyltransferase [Paenibacillus sp. CC-CFT747]|nr:class I SAM-dependent methyltransferase [Paenibacillus sp. CC-CFT747]